jgi:hypothetical protein
MQKNKLVSSLAAGFALLSVLSVANADMIVTLKNGRSQTVNVNKEDIVSITFVDGKPGRGVWSDSQHHDSSSTWDFETGQLNGWTATGTAFNRQPTYGDNPSARHRGQPSNHQGNYWIGTYENRPTPQDTPGTVQGDGPKGTLTSQPFVISKPAIGFLVGGGCDMNGARIELVVEGVVHRQSTGKCTETMAQTEWNVSGLIGKEAVIRLVDNSSGGWGHINVDAIHFY